MRIVTRNGLRQRTDAVASVPLRKVEQKILQRIIHRHTIGIHIAADIPVPQGDTFGLCIQGDAVQRTLVHRLKAEAEGMPLAELRLSGLHVKAKFITSFHKLGNEDRQLLLTAQSAFASEILTLAVHIPHHLTHQFQRFACKMTETCPADHRFLRNARPETVQRQLRKKGIPAIGGLFIGRIGLIQINVSLPQGRLEQHGERICRFITPQGTFQRTLAGDSRFGVQGHFIGHPHRL